MRYFKLDIIRFCNEGLLGTTTNQKFNDNITLHAFETSTFSILSFLVTLQRCDVSCEQFQEFFYGTVKGFVKFLCGVYK